MKPEAFALVDEAVRVHAVAALRRRGLEDAALRVAALHPIADMNAAGESYELLEEVQAIMEDREMTHDDWTVFYASRAAKCAWRGGYHDERCAISYAKDAAGGGA